MRRIFKKSIGQSILEYSVIFACVALALAAMAVYVKRGISGGLRATADDIGSQYDPAHTTTPNPITTITQSDTESVSYTQNILSPDKTVAFMRDESYSVTGPTSEDITSTDGTVIFPADPNRREELTTRQGVETTGAAAKGEKLW